MNIIHLPIEPIPLRYSEDWLRIYEAQKGHGEHFMLGTSIGLCSDLGKTMFLNPLGTQWYKTTQMEEVLRWIQYNMDSIKWGETVFFFHDLWNPMVESLFYIRDAMNLPFKVAGCLHAGSYDPFDFLTKVGMQRWAGRIESAWFREVDLIFVATSFHKQMLIGRRGVDPEKICISGFPMKIPEWKETKKEDLVVFPHRLCSEKAPKAFDDLVSLYHKINIGRDVKFVKTMELPEKEESGLTWKEEQYYGTLRKAKVSVSFALQETWGIAMQESLFCGCLPLVPDRLSYQEMYPEIFRYKDHFSFLNKLEWFLSSYEEIVRLPETRKTILRLTESINASVIIQKARMRNLI